MIFTALAAIFCLALASAVKLWADKWYISYPVLMTLAGFFSSEALVAQGVDTRLRYYHVDWLISTFLIPTVIFNTTLSFDEHSLYEDKNYFFYLIVGVYSFSILIGIGLGALAKRLLSKNIDVVAAILFLTSGVYGLYFINSTLFSTSGSIAAILIGRYLSLTAGFSLISKMTTQKLITFKEQLLLSLFFTGARRFLSVDYWVNRRFECRLEQK